MTSEEYNIVQKAILINIVIIDLQTMSESYLTLSECNVNNVRTLSDFCSHGRMFDTHWTQMELHVGNCPRSQSQAVKAKKID